MQSLDQILSERSIGQFREEMQRELSFREWTPENRDEKMAKAREIAERVAEEGVVFVTNMLETLVDGKTLLWHSLMYSLVQGELELMVNLRDELDTTPAEALPDVPIDTTWITQQIRTRYQEVAMIGALIEQSLLQEQMATEDV